ncbi:hypothetical protein T492DRAFT_329956 [Pavlovales sp. CCMP2436]|nr:hypothetical protein T492DRAFT_329956 [Pavlovales sp. CCMP2436]
MSITCGLFLCRTRPRGRAQRSCSRGPREFFPAWCCWLLRGFFFFFFRSFNVPRLAVRRRTGIVRLSSLLMLLLLCRYCSFYLFYLYSFSYYSWCACCCCCFKTNNTTSIIPLHRNSQMLPRGHAPRLTRGAVGGAPRPSRPPRRLSRAAHLRRVHARRPAPHLRRRRRRRLGVRGGRGGDSSCERPPRHPGAGRRRRQRQR